MNVVVDLIVCDGGDLGTEVALDKGAGEDLLARSQEVEKHGRLAVELGGDRLLDEIFSLEDAGQQGLGHRVGPLVGRDIGEPELVVEFLLGDVVGTDVRNDLPGKRLGLVLLAASGKRDGGGQGQNRRGDPPPSARTY